MRGTAAVFAGLVLVGGLAGCGQDSVEDANAEVCSSLADLQGEVTDLQDMLTGDATRDQLEIQVQSIIAQTKTVVLDARNLAESVKADLEATGDQLRSDIGELDDESLSDGVVKSTLTSAAGTYQAGVADVTSQLGCPAQ